MGFCAVFGGCAVGLVVGVGIGFLGAGGGEETHFRWVIVRRAGDLS